MIKIFDKATEMQFSVMPPLYLPFYNQWGANAYYRYDAFSLDPFGIVCSSTSGSPVLLTPCGFFGFLNEAGGRFSYDGKGTLTVSCPAGQMLYYNESCNPYEEWLSYNATILAECEKSEPQAFFGELEYCTWVDQKRFATEAGTRDMQSALNEAYVYDYMRRIDRLGLPHGKLTIDDGWDVSVDASGGRIYGNWQVNREKFPHMERLVRDMTDEGFIPGLWFAPFTLTPNCEIAKKHPELIGEVWQKRTELGIDWTFIKPASVLEKYYTDIFSYYIGMGFKKLKLDMSYGKKGDMKALLKMIYGIVKRIDPTVEVEAHIPDIFVSRYSDTVRINDVVFDDEGKWRGVTMEHYKVCRYSSPDKILNLDHLGTNTPIPREADFLEHTEMLLGLSGGYPSVSLLPDLYGGATAERFRAAVREWKERHRA